jgi:hypothetical protein
MKAEGPFLQEKMRLKGIHFLDSYIVKSENLSLSLSDVSPEIFPPLVGGD